MILSNIRGAVNNDDRKEKAEEKGYYRDAEGPYNNRIISVIILPPYSSPASLSE
jgi:hypothetical protein